MKNQDKINILHDSLTHYYNSEIEKKEKLSIHEAKKIYDEYDEISRWIDDLCQVLDMSGERAGDLRRSL